MKLLFKPEVRPRLIRLLQKKLAIKEKQLPRIQQRSPYNPSTRLSLKKHIGDLKKIIRRLTTGTPVPLDLVYLIPLSLDRLASMSTLVA